MHPRVSLSAISTFRWSLEQDLEFYAEAGITNVGVSAAKLDRAGWPQGVGRITDAGLHVSNVIGLGPLRLDRPEQWASQRPPALRAIDAAALLAADCVVFTTGPAGRLSWEEAADALVTAHAPITAEARRRGVELAIEHTNPLRVDVGFVHTLRDAFDLARRLGTGVCMEVNACWTERNLARTITDNVDALRLVQVSDYAVGTLSTPDRLVPGDGDIPIERIVRTLLDAGYAGCFDLELIGPRIEEEGYAPAARRAVERVTALLTALGA